MVLRRDIFTFTPYTWRTLNSEGRRIQSELLREFLSLTALLEVLLRDQPDNATRSLSEFKDLVQNVLEQGSTGFRDIASVNNGMHEALNKVLSAIDDLPDPSEGLATMIPDTNALILNPAIERWRFVEAEKFLILLTPSVLAELDELKMNHRVESVRDKAKALIRQMKEYRRRGKLGDGVPLTKGVSSLAAIALEPRVQTTLTWLDLSNNDDRLLASVVEVMRQRPRSPVLLVTSDINLQTKAEFAEIPFVEPPDP